MTKKTRELRASTVEALKAFHRRIMRGRLPFQDAEFGPLVALASASKGDGSVYALALAEIDAAHERVSEDRHPSLQDCVKDAIEALQ